MKIQILHSIIAFLLWIFIFQSSTGQDYIKFDRITTENGLPQEHVFAILEDKQGFLWIGMESGLARYDGYSFKNYLHNSQDSTSISSNIIRAIVQDQKGFIWVGTDGGGVSRYDPTTDQFANFKYEPNNPNSLSGNRVYGIACADDGAIWVATLTSGLNRITFSDKNTAYCKNSICFTRFAHLPNDTNSLADNNIWTLIIDRKNRLWAGTISAGVDMLNLNSDMDKGVVFSHFQHRPEDPLSISSNSIKSIYEDTEGTTWVGTEFEGLNRFNSEHNSFTSWQFEQGKAQSLSDNHVSSLFEDTNSNFWVGTNGGGVNIFDRNKEIFIRHKNVPTDPYSLNGNLVNTIHQSQSGILWFGMSNKGLNFIDPQKQLIKHFYPIPGNEGSLNSNLIKAIYNDRKGEIWVGAFGGGLSHFNQTTEKFTNYKQPIIEGAIAKNNVQRIFEDSRGNFWIGTDGAGLFLFDRNKKKFTEYNTTTNGSALSGKAVWSICEDLKGNIWVGTAGGGLNQLNWNTKGFNHFLHDPAQPNSINSNDIRVVFEDHLGILWVGTYGGGLNRFNPMDKTFKQYTTLKSGEKGISNDIITTIFESPLNQQLWIGTFGGGLNRFDRLTESFTHFRESDGLPNDVVKSIEEDSDGNLWVSTLNGISKFNPTSNSFVNYNTSDGLQGNGFNLGTSCIGNSGSMFFGGTNGLNMFLPNNIKQLSNRSVNCHITDLKIFNHSIQPGEKIRNRIILKKVIEQTDQITIPYFIDDFSFEFAAIDFAKANKMKYSYKLEGVKDDWSYTDSNHRFASYSNLPSGDYVFMVRATNSASNWSNEITKLKVKIQPAPWKTIWAYLIYLTAFLLSIYFFRKYEIARFKIKNELKFERIERKKTKELNEMKLRFFTNISHEIRTPLTLILSPIKDLITTGDIRRETRNQLENINRNANRLLLLVNQLLEFRRQEAGHTDLQVAKGNFRQFMLEIIISFKDFAQRRNIDLTFEASQDDIPLWYDAEKMERVFFNLLSNAFKFTPDNGEVIIQITQEEKTIKIKIEDNGQGIPSKDLPNVFDRFHKFSSNYQGSYLGSGIGLALVKKLIELHHGTIEVESEFGEFTRFIIELPTGMKHFKDAEIISDFKNSEHASFYQIEQEENASIKSIELPLDAPEILIVEDNADVRGYLNKLFSPQYQIHEAINGVEGWDKALKLTPDLIISDIMMPEMDGIDFCKKSKTSIETSHIPFILLTARASSIYRAEGFETGADDYITKPFDSELLKLRVKNLITSRKRLREKFSRNVEIEPSDITITSPDQDLLQRAIAAVEKHMDNSTFDVSTLAKEIGVSRPVLYRKLPAITDSTPNEFIRIIRLKRAAQILAKSDYSIADVCHQTGFKTPKYFSKCFREFFNILPSEYAKQKRIKE